MFSVAILLHNTCPTINFIFITVMYALTSDCPNRMVLESALGWYQGRISLYDKQSWETTVEQRILQGLSYTPRKTANPKTEFIDVDLVRGVCVLFINSHKTSCSITGRIHSS